jgi:hypothetical protein
MSHNVSSARRFVDTCLMTHRRICRFVLALLATLSFSSVAATAAIVATDSGAAVAAQPDAHSWR